MTNRGFTFPALPEFTKFKDRLENALNNENTSEKSYKFKNLSPRNHEDYNSRSCSFADQYPVSLKIPIITTSKNFLEMKNFEVYEHFSNIFKNMNYTKESPLWIISYRESFMKYPKDRICGCDEKKNSCFNCDLKFTTFHDYFVEHYNHVLITLSFKEITKLSGFSQ
jgi:hypothetical protein